MIYKKKQLIVLLHPPPPPHCESDLWWRSETCQRDVEVQPSPNTLNNSKKYNNRLYECTVTVSWVRQKPARREEALKTCQLCNKWGTIVCVLSWNYIIVCRWCSEVHGSWNFPEAQKTCEPFNVEKNLWNWRWNVFPRQEKSKWEIWKRSQRCQH